MRLGDLLSENKLYINVSLQFLLGGLSLFGRQSSDNTQIEVHNILHQIIRDPIAILVLILLLPDRLDIVAATWGILAFGDGMATVVGRRMTGPAWPWNPDKTLAELKRELPRTWQSPTMSPHCDDEVKYDVVDRMVKHYEKVAANGGELAGQKIRELITVNGIRIVLDDGTWGLVRASSNKPELVVVVESPTSEKNMRAIFAEIDAELSKQPEVGAYNQKI